MSDFTPYQPPGFSNYSPQKFNDAPTPPVFYFYAFYCACLALLYVACVVGGIFLLAGGATLAETDEDRMGMMVLGIMMAVLCTPLAFVFGIAPFLPRKKWAWVYGIVCIAIGFTSGCTFIPCVPLLIFWLQDPTKRYFNADR